MTPSCHHLTPSWQHATHSWYLVTTSWHQLTPSWHHMSPPLHHVNILWYHVSPSSLKKKNIVIEKYWNYFQTIFFLFKIRQFNQYQTLLVKFENSVFFLLIQFFMRTNSSQQKQKMSVSQSVSQYWESNEKVLRKYWEHTDKVLNIILRKYWESTGKKTDKVLRKY